MPTERHIEITPPFYELFPLDFISEFLIPYPFEDLHTFHFHLQKSKGSSLREKEAKKIWQKGEAIRKKYKITPNSK